MADTATASVDEIMAEKRAPCSQSQPTFLRSKTYNSRGVYMAVLAMTIKKAREMTGISICTAEQ